MEKILYREGFTAEELPNEVIERIKGVSYKENPYVKLGDLAYLRGAYRGEKACAGGSGYLL